MSLGRLPNPFDHPDWLFELKWDGLRAVAFSERGSCRLVSRNGHAFRAFARLCDHLAALLAGRSVFLDGEIVCLDAGGRAQFYQLLCRRAEPYFYAFDCLWLDGKGIRPRPLLERKRALRELIPAQPSRLPYVSHVEGSVVELFNEVCRQDLEGIVAKGKDGQYGTPNSLWFKIDRTTRAVRSLERHACI